MAADGTTALAGRYVLAGALNTAASYLLYGLLLLVLVPVVAYTVAYVACLVSALWLQSKMVFKRSMPTRRVPLFFGSYLLQWAVGSLIVFAGTRAGFHPLLAGAAAICVTLAMGFVISRWLFAAPANHANPNHE